MAIESFLPIEDAKKTVEKKVKEKPKFKDLITVESPGKPMPAINLENENTSLKKRKIRKTPTSKAKVKRDSIIIITEKPQAAFKIAQALGKERKYVDNGVSFYEIGRDGEKIIVACAVGHLLNLTYSKGQKGWPIFKTEWQPSYLDKHAAFTKKYYTLLQKLSKRAKEVIIATDFDIEGEVIGWNVLRFIFKNENAKRMKFSTLTKDEIIKSYENPLPTLVWSHAYAGETRHHVDWLYGINLSRALMSAIKRTGSFRIFSIGRVQGPALKIIVERDREIKKFKPVPFWQIIANAKGLDFKHPKDIFDEEQLKLFENINEAQAETKKKVESIQPPYPFDLTTLQREAHNKINFSPSRTLHVAQSLYLDSLISYPRTSSQKIPSQINPKGILKKLESKFEEVKMAIRNYPIEGKKTDPAHPSIYPTGEFKKMNEDEEKLYNLIVKRFISCFSPDAKTENKKITLVAKDKDGNEVSFTRTGLQILEHGWTSVYPSNMNEEKLPDLNGHVNLDKINFLDKETQPPKRYSSASLISILEKKNLGTKATRTHIVETLFDRGYLDGKSIMATPLGEKLIEALEEYSPIIIDENLTRHLDEQMESFVKDNTNLKEKEDKIISQTEKAIMDISKDFKAHEYEIGKKLLHGTEELRELIKKNNKIMPCPKCKKGNLTIKYSRKIRRYFAACDSYPECDATYSLPPNSLIKTTDKVNEDGMPILMAIRKGKRPWLFPFDVNWKQHQEQEKQQAQAIKDKRESE